MMTFGNTNTEYLGRLFSTRFPELDWQGVFLFTRNQSIEVRGPNETHTSEFHRWQYLERDPASYSPLGNAKVLCNIVNSQIGFLISGAIQLD